MYLAKRFSLFILILISIPEDISAQRIDTLDFFSESFQTNRKIVVHTPEFFKYQTEEVKRPLYIILDAQHEWLVNPAISTIKYLTFTKEIPSGIIVEIPLEDRIAECAIPDDGEATLALHKFITEEVMEVLEPSYPSNGFKLLIGHSMSASFALYSLAHSPEFYSAVFAHSPMDELETLVTWMSLYSVPTDKIFISVGGAHQSKDKYHRQAIEDVRKTYPGFFEDIEFYTADQSAHNAVPLVSNPIFFTKLFQEYSYRFTHIAEVDMNYQLKEFPESIEMELNKIQASSDFMDKDFSLEVSDINGIASRYLTNDNFSAHALELYELGVELYPEYFEFYIYLAEFSIPTDPKAAKAYLKKSKLLLNTHESNSEDYEYFLEYIHELLELVK